MSDFWKSVLTAFGKAAKDASPEELDAMVTTTATALDAAPAVPAQDVPVPGLPQGRYRVWCALAALLCAALAFAGCLVWTPTYYQTVYGFQGRYLLPVLPLFLLTCLPRRVQVASGKQSACTLVCCLCVVNAGVLLNAMLAVIAR